MKPNHPKSLDRIAVAVCLSGILITAAIAIGGRVLDENLTMIAFGVFVAFELAALVLGIVSRAQPLGRTASITSGILLAGSLLFLG